MMIGGAAQSDAKTTPDISGFWELNFDSRQVLLREAVTGSCAVFLAIRTQVWHEGQPTGSTRS
jgi:hypothetical protein